MWRLYDRGVRGILLSGGFTKEGALPLAEYVPVLKRFKSARPNFVMSVHPGLLNDMNVISELKNSIDVVDFEFNLNQNYLLLRNLPFKPKIYIETLDKYLETGLYVVPHITLDYPGFSEGTLVNELKALSDRDIDAVTILIFIPVISTRFSDYNINTKEVIKHISLVRKHFDGRIYLGCMRPASVKRLVDVYAVKEGIAERVANPYHRLAKSANVEMYDACCSLPERLLHQFKMS